MKKKFKGLNSGEVEEGLLILAALCIVIFVFIIPSNKLGPVPGIFNTVGDKNNWTTPNKTTPTGPSTDSTFASNITIGSGNASYEINPWNEYITIEASGENPIDITGWLLKNNKDTKTYEISGNIIHYAVDALTIPKAAKFISPTGNNSFVDIVLKDGDRVVVSSGSSGITTPYKIVNFRENKCSGYLEDLPEYQFTPPLERSCPQMKNEIGYSNLDRTCRDFISGLSSCYTPKFDGVDQNREACTGCVDGRANLSNSCVNFLKQHATYAMCINNHQTDADFNLKTWRIFLGRSFEMWDKSEETISLIDSYGKLVNYLSY